MDNILLVFLCLLAGVFLRRLPTVASSASQSLNQYVIYIALPAMTLFYIPKIELSSGLLFPLGIAWIGFGLSFVFFWSLGKMLGWSKKLIGCLILMGGLGNTSFVGFPIVEALYGSQGLKTAIVVDQPGTFLVMATLGIGVASYYSSGMASSASMIRKILFFPPFIAFMVAVVMNAFNFDFHDALQGAFQKIGATVSPVALVAVGLQIRIEKTKHMPFALLGLFFKLVLTPLFFLVLYKLILSRDGMDIDVSIIESAMAPMVTASVLASTYNLKPRLASLMIGIGIPASLVTIGLWYWLLS
jgi:predicted permease